MVLDGELATRWGALIPALPFRFLVQGHAGPRGVKDRVPAFMELSAMAESLDIVNWSSA